MRLFTRSLASKANFLVIMIVINCAIFAATSPTEKNFSEKGNLRRIRKSRAKKQGRFLSNPLGFILGNPSCKSSLNGKNVTGLCYNEMECLLRGGSLAGYCSGGPPVLVGACCIFETSTCPSRISEKTVYFKNKSYPQNDISPFQCLLSIKPLSDTCWVSFTRF